MNDVPSNALWRFLLCLAVQWCVLGGENEDKLLQVHFTYSRCWLRSAGAISAPFISKAAGLGVIMDTFAKSFSVIKQGQKKGDGRKG